MQLIKKIQKLKQGKIRKIIHNRIKEFEKIGKSSTERIFQELCFCILTANFNAEKSINIQNILGDKFLELTQEKLRKKLKELGYRFPNTRASYIVEARNIKDKLKEILSKSETEAREFLVENVKGFGYKEASHFLRNVGKKNLAIIDFHIIDILTERGVIKNPKTKSLTKSTYLEIENTLRQLAEKLNLSLAELDLYLWYLETGKILK
ncbi:MAG: N-glycosylase/DNA lyase [Candidatus Pacearchaeota archaeon]